MVMNTLDAKTLQKAFLAGAKELESKKEWINELNVFPVPDGDTGTNMTMTIMAAAREVAAIEEPTMELLAKAISSGSLRGARGNSGVILSQLFRGFTKEIRTVDVITTATLADAFMRAKETAYKAVMKPKEGTILTVARGMADKAAEMAGKTDDIIEFMQAVVECGDEVLSQTPELLPILKQAGVVDSGGQGLMQVMKGALNGLLGKGIPFTEDVPQETGGEARKTDANAAGMPGEEQRTDAAPGEERDESILRTEAVPGSGPETADIRFGYCTEFLVNLEKEYDEEQEAGFKAYLESIGDSIVLVSDGGVVKVHVHTNDPGLAIQKALTFGSLSKIKVDNMREEHHERLIRDAERLAAQQKRKELTSAAMKEAGNDAAGGIGNDSAGLADSPAAAPGIPGSVTAQAISPEGGGTSTQPSRSCSGTSGSDSSAAAGTATASTGSKAATDFCSDLSPDPQTDLSPDPGTGAAVKGTPRKDCGFIAVSMGDGFADIFKGIGADCLIEGGQTMNPSTEDMLNAIDQVNADTVYILPNNGNIILAAQQAAYLVKDKRIVVIPSKTVPQGISALINFVPGLAPEENEKNMIEEMNRVRTAEITYAVRHTIIEDKEIEEGDIMGLDDHHILSVAKSVETAALDALKEMLEEESELVSIYYGQDISEEEAGTFLKKAQALCPQCEVELNYGGQPIYYYLISVE